MAESVTVSARLPADCKRRLDAMLNGRSLGAWLQNVVDGLERVGNLEARARELERAIAEREAGLKALEEKVRQRQAALEELQALRRAGVSPEQVSKWSAILSRAGTEPSELESDIERYGSLLAGCRELEAREKKLEASVGALEGKRGELEGAAAALRDAAVSAIAGLKEQAVAEVEAAGAEMGEKIKAYGEACRLSELLRRDLFLAGALYAMGTPELAAEVLPPTVLLVLDRVKRWSEATGANPRARPPEAITGGNWSHAAWQLTLRELVLWAAVTLVPLCQEGTSASP
ncbi:MAG: hypothetical protein QME70_09595 [Bacillota bacterium]|nr:hypothetical protein [Bacillota bacterium]